MVSGVWYNILKYEVAFFTIVFCFLQMETKMLFAFQYAILKGKWLL